MNDRELINADNLPLDVREHLMRGRQDDAIALLESQYSKTKSEAEALIEAYRENLRERKVALDIQIMNEQNAREADEQRQLIIRWAVRGAFVVVLLALLMLMPD